MMGLVQCWTHPQGGRGCQHLSIEAGQLGAVAVQRHRKMQGITSTEAEGWIQKQLSCLTEAIAFERAQFNTDVPPFIGPVQIESGSHGAGGASAQPSGSIKPRHRAMD